MAAAIKSGLPIGEDVSAFLHAFDTEHPGDPDAAAMKMLETTLKEVFSSDKDALGELGLRRIGPSGKAQSSGRPSEQPSDPHHHKCGTFGSREPLVNHPGGGPSGPPPHPARVIPSGSSRSP